MSYFKRFTDFCAGFAAFSALLYLVRSFMTFKRGFEDEDVSILKIVKEFISKANADDYRAYVIVAVLFILSLLIGIALKKFPFVALSVSTVPMVAVIGMFEQSRLDERPMLYILLGALHVIGCLFECIVCDREKRFKKLHCTFIAGSITTFLGGALSLFTMARLSEMKSLVKTVDKETFDMTELSSFDAELFNLVEQTSSKGYTTESTQLLVLAIMYIVILIVTMFVGEIFFIDFIFSLVPLVSIIVCYNSGIFLPQADMLATLSLITTVIYFAAMLFGTNFKAQSPEPIDTPAEPETIDTPNEPETADTPTETV